MNYDYRNTIAVMDIECYVNYFLVAFRSVKNPDKTLHYEAKGRGGKLDAAAVTHIKDILRKSTLITFNGNNYDVPLLLCALDGAPCANLKRNSDKIINHGLAGWQFLKEKEMDIPAYIDNVDIIGIPKGKLGLKTYSARLGFKKLQDLPINPDVELTEQEMVDIATYCDNDTANTLSLFMDNYIKSRVDLRISISNQYGIDMRSKSDAQVGEAIFKSVIEKKTNNRLYKPHMADVKTIFKYDIPEYIVFNNPVLIDLYDTLKTLRFRVDTEKGKVDLPNELKNKINIGDATYTLGIGGLHSNEKAQAIVAADDEFISDIDVGSYYPSIIIDGGYYPSQLGIVFLKTYKQFRDDRLRMKHDPSKKAIVETYKIALNGSFGKLSSKYSFLFSPKMLIQVTLTGQLCLLMLIERLVADGLRVVSANTDGIVVYGKKTQRELLEKHIAKWEIETGFTMEYTPYKAIYSMSVNSYLALKENGKWKQKGDCGERNLEVSGNKQVCIEAAKAYLKDGTPIRQSIENHTDFVDFTNFQQVKSGAYKDGVYLGKVVRWYYSKDTHTEITNLEGNRIPLTQGAKPCMELLDEIPPDIDYNWYIRETHKMLSDLGVKGVKLDSKAFGLVKNGKPLWGHKEGQVRWHLIDLSTKEALCGAELKDRHADWVYLGKNEELGKTVCVTCRSVKV